MGLITLLSNLREDFRMLRDGEWDGSPTACGDSMDATEAAIDMASDLLAACHQLLAAIGEAANMGYVYGSEVGVANRAIAKAEGK